MNEFGFHKLSLQAIIFKISGVYTFILTIAVIGLSCHQEFDEKKQLDHESIISFPLIDSIFYSYFMKALKHSSCGFKSAIKNLGCWDNTKKACKSLVQLPVIFKLFSCSPSIPRGLLRQ